MTITGNDLIRLGWKSGKAIGEALRIASQSTKSDEDMLSWLDEVRNFPWFFPDSNLAKMFMKPEPIQLKEEILTERGFNVFGRDLIDDSAIEQMEHAMSLPVVVTGALMSDSHKGYGLPIGGVLATRNAVIPFGIGYDIACRMKLTIFNASAELLDVRYYRQSHTDTLNANTRFGKGAAWEDDELPYHEVLDDSAWNATKLLRSLKDKARIQLGTSGSGNHFVEFGELTYPNLQPMVALLSHSGSRGIGHTIAEHYVKIAKSRVNLPDYLADMAWLDMDTEAGQEYWLSMELAGRFASACHAVIHEKIGNEIMLEVYEQVENHHNYCFLEEFDGETLYVHRKGATPAGLGVMGIIPGSMATPGYLVRGLGNPLSLNSASHGAGRRMGRRAAIREGLVIKSQMQDLLDQNDVTLIGGDLDEAPQAYKDINAVMNRQLDLVEIVAKFQPKIVKMAGAGEKDDV